MLGRVLRCNDTKLSWNSLHVHIICIHTRACLVSKDLVSGVVGALCSTLGSCTQSFSRSSFEDPESQQSSGLKIQHPASRVLAASQEAHLQPPDKAKQKDLEPMTLGTTPEAIEIVSNLG